MNRGDLTFVDSHASKLLAEYEEQLGHIQDYLEKNRKEESINVIKKTIEKAELLQEMESALDSLEDFQAKECAHKIEGLLECQLETDTEAALEKVKEQLKLYEDEAAEQMLRELIERIR